VAALRVIGIDPGSRLTGFGVLEQRGGTIHCLDSGCVRCGDGPFIERLGTIFNGVRQLMMEYRPDELAIERVFMHRNADSALKLGQARGAALSAVLLQSVVIAEYAPTEIKQAVVGRGHATKEQVQHMMQALLRLTGRPQSDAADALAVALCHLHHRASAQRLAVAATGGGVVLPPGARIGGRRRR